MKGGKDLDVGSKLDLSDLHVLKAQFTAVEKAGGDGIDLDGFVRIMGPKLGGQADEAELTRMFMMMDADCGGTVDWDEFTNFIFLTEQEQDPAADTKGEDWVFKRMEADPPPSSQWHQEYLEHIRYVPGLDRYMTTGRDAVIKMWNASDLSHRQTFNLSNPAWITDACAIPGEGLVALASTDRSCMFRFFEFRHGLVSTMVGSCSTSTMGGPMSMTCDTIAEEEVLVYGDTNGTAVLLKKSDSRREDLYRSVWQLEPENVVQVHQQHTDWVTGVRLVPDLEAVITCSLDRTCLVSDVHKQKVRYKVGVHSKAVYALDWCRHHRVFASCGIEHDLMVWSPNGRLVGELQGHKTSVMGVVSVGVSQMASCDQRGTVKLWDLRTHRCLDTLEGGPGKVSALAFDPPATESGRPGRLLLGGQYLRAWPHVVVDEQDTEPLEVSGAAYSEQLDMVASVDEESRLSVWSAATGRPAEGGGVPDTHGKVQVTAMVLDPEGRRALTAAGDGVVKMWNFNSGKLLKEFRHHLAKVDITGLVFVPPRNHGDNATVVACGWGGQVLLWEDKGSGPVVDGHRSLAGHKDDVLCCSFCPPDTLATGDYAGRIVVWSLTSGAERLDLQHNDASSFDRPCEVLLFLPRRLRTGYPPLLSGGAGGLVRVWSIRADGSLEHTLLGSSAPGEGIAAMCTDKKNTSVFAGDTAGWVRWWDVQHLGDSNAHTSYGLSDTSTALSPTAGGGAPRLHAGKRSSRSSSSRAVPVASAFFEVVLFRASQVAIESLAFADPTQCLVVASGKEIVMWSTARGIVSCLRKVGHFGQPKPWSFRDPRAWASGDEEAGELPRPPPPKPPKHKKGVTYTAGDGGDGDSSPEPAAPHASFHSAGLAAVVVAPHPARSPPRPGEALPPIPDSVLLRKASSPPPGVASSSPRRSHRGRGGAKAMMPGSIPRLNLQRASVASQGADPWGSPVAGADPAEESETPTQGSTARGGGSIGKGAPRPLLNPPAFERAARVPSFLPTPSPRPDPLPHGMVASSAASRIARQATARASSHGRRGFAQGSAQLYQGVGEVPTCLPGKPQTLPRTGRRKSARERLAMRNTAGGGGGGGGGGAGAGGFLSPVPSVGSVAPSQAGRDDSTAAVAAPRMPKAPPTARPPEMSPKSPRRRGAGVVGAAARLADPSCDVLDLAFGFIQDTGIASLSGAIRGSTSLAALELEMNGLGPEGSAALAEAMAGGATMLTRLGLARNAVGPAGAKALGRAMSAPGAVLTELDMSGNGIGAQGAQALADAMASGHCALATLVLSGNGVGSDGAVALAQGIAAGRGGLTRLDLSDNWIMDVGATALADMLRRGGGALTSLDLSGNRIKDAGAASFAEAFTESRAGGDDGLALEELNLLYNPVGMGGAAALAGAVNTTARSCLRTICGFSGATVRAGERFDDGDTSLMVVELRLNIALTSLDLQGCGISDVGAGALAEGLRSSKSLASVNLYCCGIQDAGADALATALEENTSLTHLNLHLNTVGNAGAKAVGAALKKNTSLTELSLQANRIGDAGALSLMDGLRENGTLRAFNLWGNRLRAIDLDQLIPAADLNDTSVLTTVCGFTASRVDLSFSGIRDAEAQLLAMDLIINHQLCEANLLGNRLTDAGVRVITMATTRRASEGRSRVSLCGIGSSGWRVDLAGKGMGDVDAWLLAMELQGNRTITQLDLEGGKVGDPGASALADALRANRSLARINLLHNQLGPEGVRILADAVEDAQVVRTVCGILEPSAEVAGRSMSDVRLLALELRINPSITDLNLGRTLLGDAGAEVLAEGIKASDSLTTLNVLGCGIGQAGARALMAAVEGTAKRPRRMATVCGFSHRAIDLSDMDVFHLAVLEVELRINATLTDLNLRGCKVGGKGAASVASGLRGNASLTRLNMWGCGVDDTGAKLLMEAVARNRSLESLDLGGNRQGTVPMEIVDRGASAVVEFMREIGREGGAALPRVKWMLVGRGEAGKTSMLNTLRHPDAVPQLAAAWDRTVMLDVLEWVPPGGGGGGMGGGDGGNGGSGSVAAATGDLVVSVWDCGGQEDYWRGGNQMFLTELRTLYVVVFDMSHTPPSVRERDADLAPNENWTEFHELRRLRDYVITLMAHVPSCAMYLVGTKADQLALEGRDAHPPPPARPAAGDDEITRCIQDHQATYARRSRAVGVAARCFDDAVKRQLRPNLLFYEYSTVQDGEGRRSWNSVEKKAVVRKQGITPEQKAADLEATALERDLQNSEELAEVIQGDVRRCAERAGRLQRKIMEASKRPPRDPEEEAGRAHEIHHMAEENKALQEREKKLRGELAAVATRREALEARRRILFWEIQGEAGSVLGPDAGEVAFRGWAKRQRTAREFRGRRIAWRWRNLRALVDDLMELKTSRRLGAARSVLEAAVASHRADLDALAIDLRERIERDAGGAEAAGDAGSWLRERHAAVAARLARPPPTLFGQRSTSALDASSVGDVRADLLSTSRLAFPEAANVVPSSWARLVAAVSRLAQGPVPVMSMSAFREHVYNQCRFTHEKRFERAVRFMHAIGVLCNFDSTPDLQDVVIVRPQWLVDAFKEVVRHDFRHVERLGGRLATVVRELRTEGRLSEDFDWGGRVDPPIPTEVMTALMQQFDLAAPLRRGELLVPSMLPTRGGSAGPLSAGPARACLGLVVSPPAAGLFERLVARCAGFSEVRGGWRAGGRGGGFQGFVPSAGGALTVRMDGGRVIIAGKGSGAGAAVHRAADALSSVIDESFPGVSVATTMCVCVSCLKGAMSPSQAVGEGSTLGQRRLEEATEEGGCPVCGSASPGWDVAGLPARAQARRDKDASDAHAPSTNERTGPGKRVHGAGGARLSQLVSIPSLVPLPPPEADDAAGGAPLVPSAPTLLLPVGSRGPGCFGPTGHRDQGGAAAEVARGAALAAVHASVGGAGIKQVRVPLGGGGRGVGEVTTQLCKFGTFLLSASSTSHLLGLARALEAAPPLDSSGSLASRVGALLADAWSPPPYVGAECRARTVDFVTRDVQARAIGAPGMRVVGWRALEQLGRIPRFDEGLSVSVYEAMHAVATRYQRTDAPSLPQYEDNPFSGAPVPPDFYPHLDSETASLPRLRLEFVSHRWLRPSADARKAHPDDEAGSKARALVEYGRREALGPQRRETYFWIDYSSVDQENPQPYMQALPLYVSTCAGMLALCDDEYDGRAWCRVEQALCAAFCPKPMLTVVPMPGSTVFSTYGRYRWGHKKALLDPNGGKVTSRRDMQEIAALAEAAGRHYSRAWVCGSAEMGRLLSGVNVGSDLQLPLPDGAGATELALEVAWLRRIQDQPPEGWETEVVGAHDEGGGAKEQEQGGS